jgi:endonuclease/exonuclease/phosphatase family metal-dependent hydrolase
VDVRLVTYNMGQGGSRNPALWARLLPSLAADLLFVQESRDPTGFQLGLGELPNTPGTPGTPATPHTSRERWLWAAVPGGRWGSGLWVRDGRLTPLSVPTDFAGRVVAAVIEGRHWPGSGDVPVVALSIHAPTRKGSSYVKEVGRILDFASRLAGTSPLVLAGDFNVAVGLRQPGQPIGITQGERALLQRLGEEMGLIPCWQTVHLGEPLARTLRWMRQKDSLPYHCDGLFVPSAWASAIRSCMVLEEEQWCALSDHNPVVATLALGAL